MLDLRYVVDHLDEVKAALSTRAGSVEAELSEIRMHAETRRNVIQRLESLRSERNQANQSMAQLDKKSSEFVQKRDALRALSDESKQLEEEQRTVEAKLEELMAHIPNLPAESTPLGKSSEDNPVVRTWGKKPEFAFTPKDHVDLGQGLGLLDLERARKISGARFAVLRGQGARLERALISFMVDVHAQEHGYTEMWTPVIVRDTALRGTGQLPKFAQDVFKLGSMEPESENSAYELYLIPTAEVPLTNLHADEILDGNLLPIAYTGYTPCFRSEAGNYGKDTRGLIRQHQFDKVEMVRFVKPEDAEAQLELLTGHAERILQKLGLHYRVVALCAGDLGFSAKKTYDLEVWLPSQNAYREISSCSWFGDFQARRASIRYRAEAGAKPQYVHTLNGSGLAIGRTWLAILEQYQAQNGSVRIPEALEPYMNGLKTLTAA